MLDVLEAGEEGRVEQVVATWETPPPRSSLNTPSLMMNPSVKPFATVRSPTVSLRLNVSPGLSTVPLTSSAARPRLTLR